MKEERTETSKGKQKETKLIWGGKKKKGEHNKGLVGTYVALSVPNETNKYKWGILKSVKTERINNQCLGLFCALHLFASVLSGEVGVWGMICFGRRKV